ncbi:DUF87 domain-containing protein [Haloterrigena sp. SYSU A558-1]|uniref:DUF87 domain-containing protein n=1 Tax=Haloterrigena gelatinilytica TaxID=2741724 RepID=A0ABX2LEU5_9EURY|nr:DUF87 domain-containing protein [Haloterrigena gelatinilytica]NUC74787.1 DUF87 domain-containing protein [Haloterrigena gelatinilytica]
MPDVTRLRRLAEQAGIADNDQVQNLLAVAAASPNDTVVEQVHKVLQVAASKHRQHPFETPNIQSLATVPGDRPADLDLGTVLGSSAAFTLPETVLTRHVLVAGETGAGKTTLFYSIVDQVRVPVWLFDLKTDYRHLLRENPDLVVVPWTTLRLNPLQPPPGVTPRRWAQSFHELFGDAYDLLGPSQHYLLPNLLDLYAEQGLPLDESVSTAETFPTLLELATQIATSDAKGYSQSGYKERITSRLRAMTAATANLFDCRTGYPLADLLEQDVVFEFDGLASDHQDFLMEWLLTWTYRYRSTHQQRGDQLRHVFLCDEGKRLFSAYKEQSDAKGLPKIDELTDKMREFGEALIVGDQEPKKLTDSLLANTGTKILFPIGDADQFRRVARSMALSERQRRYANQLDVGQATVQVAGSDPMVVQFHNYDLEKSVTDTELQRVMQETWTRLSNHSSSTELPRTDEADEPGEPGESVGDTADEDHALSEAAERLLHDVADQPYTNLSDRYSRLFASRYKGNKAKKALLARGLVQERDVEKKFGRPMLLELTEDGRRRLADDGVAVQRTGRGGIVHRYWQQLLKDRFNEAGYTAVREQDDADVAVELGDSRIAVEVAMEAVPRELEHVERRLQDGFDSVWIGCRNTAVKADLEEMLVETDLPTDCVHIRLLQELQTASLDRL